MNGAHRRLAALTCAALFVTLAATGCASTGAAEEQGAAAEATAEQPVTVTDAAAREVEVPRSVERVVAIGPGALRLVVYAGGADMVVGVEDIESKPPIARPYTIAHPELLELPVVGAGGPDATPDAERLIGVQPDVIFVGQIADPQTAEELQAATGIPVVVVGYGALGAFDAQLFASLETIGTVLGRSGQAAQAAAVIEDALDDLAARTADTDDAAKPTAFVGALGFKGAHGLESTQADYPPFVAIKANNVADGLGQSGSVMIDKEKLLEWDPAYLFVDLSGLSLVREDVGTNRALYESLTAVKDGRVYAQLPFNNYWTNVEIALADAYYAGTVLYPEAFSDVDPAGKADALSTALVGAPVYNRLVEIYGGGFGPVDLLETE